MVAKQPGPRPPTALAISDGGDEKQINRMLAERRIEDVANQLRRQHETGREAIMDHKPAQSRVPAISRRFRAPKLYSSADLRGGRAAQT